MTQTQPRDADVDTSGVPFAVTDRAYLRPERYYDRAFFERENQKLWPHVWQMACRLEDIPGVGDYVEYRVASYSVLVIRRSATEIKAYQNVCPHRATQLALGTGSFRGNTIVCPFHGWRWDLDGVAAHDLYGIEGFEPRCVGKDDIALVECQVGTWAGCVFVNMDRDARPLHEAMEPLPELLDPLEVASMRARWWVTIHLQANWKLALEAFMEGWHVMATHPQLTMGAGEQFPPDFMSIQRSYANGHASLQQGTDGDMQADLGLSGKAEAEKTIAFMHHIVDELGAMVLEKDVLVAESLRNTDCAPEEFSEKMIEALYAWNAGAGIRLPDPDPETLARWGSQWFVFPNFMIHPLFGNAISYRVRPDTNDPEHCVFDIWSLTLYPEGHEPGKPEQRVLAIDDPELPLIPRQDASNIERQQRGMHNPGFTTHRIARKYEDGIANAHAHLDTYLAR